MRQLLTYSLQYAQVSSCKFLSAIHPAQTPKLDINLSAKLLEDDQIQIIADGKTGDTDFIKLKATFVKK